ncbi:MAG: hypothetical protein AAB571_11360 [Chloroflexota bacterium]
MDKEEQPVNKKVESLIVCNECLMAMMGGQRFHHCHHCPCCKNEDEREAVKTPISPTEGTLKNN